MIQKRRADLHRMSHTHTIAFGQNVIRKKVFLVQPKEWSQIVMDVWQI
jgi:hypothetical protein